MSSTVVDNGEASTNLCRLRKQLADACNGATHWSYAIFWSSSPIQHGGLEWGEGYYNGDIIKKTKKRSYESDSEYGLERSKRLRNLYLCMLEGDTRNTTSNNNLMLSQDDLSNEEWYYLVCMSYVFPPAHCLPGKALATGETIWLCNAQNTETKIFTRSLLAKSASIQTVVCFPYLDGVLELGVTQLIAEDLSLIQHLKDFLLETPNPQGNSKTMSNARKSCSKTNIVEGNWKLEDLYDKKTSSNVLKFDTTRTNMQDYDMKDLALSDSGSSVLNKMIKYVQELEARVEELEFRIIPKKQTVKENILSELTEEISET